MDLDMDLNSTKEQLLSINNNNNQMTCLLGSHNSSSTRSSSGVMSNVIEISSIGSPNCENVSERSTPNSMASFCSTPNRITTPHLQQQYSPTVGTSLRTNHTTNSKSSNASIFFPPPSATRSASQTTASQHQLVASTAPIVSTANSTKLVDRSPRSADTNLSAELERSRELFSGLSNGSNATKIHHNHHHQRLSSAASQQSSNSSKLNSPIIMPAKSFPGFFPEPSLNSTSTPIEQQHSQPFVRRSINLTTSTKDELDRWPQQQKQQATDEVYHLYHEPLDVEELEQASQHQRGAPSEKPPLKSSLNSIMNSENNSQQAANRKLPAMPSSSTHERRQDVSADIYFCYVSLKANERSNQRSRSYHGQKNTTKTNHLMRPNQTLNSSSYAELPRSPPAGLGAHERGLTMRDHCVNELIGTEMNYTHALNHILTHFAIPLEPHLSSQENKLIFGHMKYFYNVHSAFQIDLVKNAPKVAMCFINFRDKFFRYGDYCATLSRAQSLLDDLINRNEKLSAELERCYAKAGEGKFKLADLLSLPMQRILKYHLLLAELIKSSNPSEDSDYEDLERAHETMVDLGKYINEAKRDTELMQIIDDIEQSISGKDMPSNTRLTDYGRLHVDGIIRVKLPTGSSSALANSSQAHETSAASFIGSRSSDKIKQKRYAFVFDKVLLMCKVGSVKGYQYKEALLLSEFAIDTDPLIVQSETISAKHLIREKWTYAFNLVSNVDQKSYTFFAKDQEMKNIWVEAIQKAFDNLRPAVYYNRHSSDHSTNHEFLMHTFERASSCAHCGKLLHGVLYQGYRCRTCFTSAHKGCLPFIKPCGPTLPPKHVTSQTLPPKHFQGTIPQLVLKDSHLKEPISPSVRSNSSDDSHHNFSPAAFQSAGDASGSTLKEASSAQGGCLGAKVELASDSNSYVNSMLKHYLWFVGRMDREQAQALLAEKPDGTFLVRVSPKHNGSYVISLIFNKKVNHMRIYVSKENQLFLSQNRYFKSVPELVSWYEKNSLVESFHMLDANLAIPYKKLQANSII